MRISDWSSDVCSSDLLGLAVDLYGLEDLAHQGEGAEAAQVAADGHVEAERATVLGEEELGAAHAGQRRAQRHRIEVGGAQHAGHALGGEQRRADALGAVLEQRRSEEHTSELQSLMRISYAVFCLKKKKKNKHKK